MRTISVEEYAEQVAAAAPPLTDAQRGRLADLLRPARSRRGTDTKKPAA
ncbi:hypothetical protein PBI_KRATIO_38 [Mycobacterium phage Kratio]|uniref:Uncharacterized protein n=1 Tax=Mycobacterium phage Kratio TaxID=1606763 RepID=A0A0C5ADK8_9CAUD|nr:hypothetical protein PBI_KRATIO_38 [Mycobacterium phage Kratio]AJK27367.1 hypothetical protein PBI_KRATIO_38 [Mycobacterium phage Kratio]